MKKIHIPTSSRFYNFLDDLPNKKIFFDTNTIHPGSVVLKPDFENCDPDRILQRIKRTNATATTFRQLGNYRTTHQVYQEIKRITTRIETIRRKAEKKANGTIEEDEHLRLLDIEQAYAEALELAQGQETMLKEMTYSPQVNSKFRDLLTKVVARYHLDTKTVSEEGQKVSIPASSKTDIELVISTFSNAETEPTGVLSLDKDIPTLFALCALILYDTRSPFRRGLIRTKPKNLTAHFFYEGKPYHRTASSISEIIRAIPTEQEKDFFNYLNRKHEELYTTSKSSGRFKITTLEDVALTD